MYARLHRSTRRATGRWGVLLLALGLALAMPARAQETDYAGTSSANFLKLPVGARGMALAGADLTAAADASALFWNPGTMPLLGRHSVTFSHMPWFAGTQVNYLAAVYQTGAGSFGFDLDFFDSGDIEETTLADQDGTGRFLSVTSYQVGLAAGRAFTDRFSVGVKAKYISETLANADARAFGMDIGAVFRTNFLNDLRLAFALTNFGTRMQYDGRDLRVIYAVPDNPEGKSVPAQLQTGEWDLPLGFRLGVSADVLRAAPYRLTLNYSVFDARDFQAQHLLGAEALLLNLVALRGGYSIRSDADQFSLGAGLRYDYRDVGSFRVDYGYANHPYLSRAQQFTFSVLF